MKCASSEFNVSFMCSSHRILMDDGYVTCNDCKLAHNAITSLVLSSCCTWVGVASSLCLERGLSEGCTCRDSMNMWAYRGEHVCFTHTTAETSRDNEEKAIHQEEIKMATFYLLVWHASPPPTGGSGCTQAGRGNAKTWMPVLRPFSFMLYLIWHRASMPKLLIILLVQCNNTLSLLGSFGFADIHTTLNT